MNLTDSDIKMFKQMQKTELGNQLVDYFQRLLDHACDSRTWDSNQTKADADRVVKLIKENFLNKLDNTPLDKRKPFNFV